MEDVISSLPRAAVVIIAWGLAARGLVSIYRVTRPVIERLIRIYNLPDRMNGVECKDQRQRRDVEHEDEDLL